MSTTTIVLLAVLWGAVLLPGLLRDRRRSPVVTVDGFHQAMERLARCDTRSVMVPGGSGRITVYPRPSARSAVLEQRRMVFARLTTVSAASLVTALVGGGWWWALALLSGSGLVAYGVALRMLVVQRERARRVIPIHPTRAAAPTTNPATNPAARVPAATADVAHHEQAEALFAGASR